MKRILCSFLLFAMAIMQSMALDFSKDGVRYTVNSNGTTVEVSHYDATSAPADGKITIAATVSDGTKTYDITSIGEYAFYNTTITGLDLSGATALETISNNAFNSCQSLSGSVTIPAKVTSIGSGAFNNTAITALNLSGATALQTIGGSAFSSCQSLSGTITIPAKVTSIGSCAFNGTAIKDIDLSGATNLQTIGSVAFSYCLSLSGTITIPAKVTSIGSDAFYNCTAITGVDLSGATNLQTIDNEAFQECKSLTGNLTIPAKVTSIGNDAFNRTAITALDLSGATALETISNNAFYGCSSLSGSVTIPATVTSIGEGAFADCQSLGGITVDAANANYKVEHEALLTKDGTKLLYFPIASTTTTYEVPATVTYIGNYAFDSCPSLSGTIKIPAAVTYIGNYAFNSTVITGLDLSGATSLQTISNGAFGYCQSLTGSVTIPATVTSIGDNVFVDCSSLSKVFFASATPPTCGGSIFYGCAADLTLYVNDGQYSYATGADNTKTNVAKYQQAANLTSYAAKFAPYLPKTVTGAKTATLYLPYEVAVPTGMKAYYGTAVTGGYLKLTALDGTVIPANTPVVLMSDAANFDFVSNQGTTALPSGINAALTGTTKDITVGTDKYLTLGESDTKAGTYGFYMYTGETIAANTCYIPYYGPEAKGLTLSIDGEATGISSVSANAADSATKVIYDLQGRRVSHPQKGIYIVNGKKIAF